MAIAPNASAIVAAEGHLIDSQLLTAIFDAVIQRGGTFEVLRFDIDRTNTGFSRLSLRVFAPGEPALDELLAALIPLGCHPVVDQDALSRWGMLQTSTCLPGACVGPAGVRRYQPAVVTKLEDGDSAQTIGVVTDVGLFLHHLASQLVPADSPSRG